MISKNNPSEPLIAEIVILDNLVPKNHIVRKINRAIDFSFIYHYTEPLYSKIGRPSIDPVVLFKLVFINHLFGYNSMRRTINEVEVNLAYRWFLGLGFNDKVPHFSDFSANYKRKFSTPLEVTTDSEEVVQKTIFEIVFDEILKQAYRKNLLSPRHIYMDSTHIKANANKKKTFDQIVVEERRYYQDELDREIDQECARQLFSQPKEVEPKTKKVKVSTSDPDCGIFYKGEHETQAAYLAQTVSDANGFVIGVKVNPANCHDSTTFSDTFQETISKFGVAGQDGICSIALDAGYKTPAVAREIIQAGITPLFPYTRPKGKKYNEDEPVKFGAKDFKYDKQHDWFVGPNQCIATARGISKETGYITYRTSAKDCNVCPLRAKCLSKSAKTKTMVRHIWQPYLDEAELIRKSEYHARYYPNRKKTIERVFADAKEKHGLRFTRLKGKQRVQDETLLIYACMNMKKIALWTA